jgi:hypothetical protein
MNIIPSITPITRSVAITPHNPAKDRSIKRKHSNHNQPGKQKPNPSLVWNPPRREG